MASEIISSSKSMMSHSKPTHVEDQGEFKQVGTKGPESYYQPLIVWVQIYFLCDAAPPGLDFPLCWMRGLYHMTSHLPAPGP